MYAADDPMILWAKDRPTETLCDRLSLAIPEPQYLYQMGRGVVMRYLETRWNRGEPPGTTPGQNEDVQSG